MKAIDIATRKVAITKPSSDVNEAIKKMKKVGFRRLPVMSKGRVVGIITLKDILAIDPSIYTSFGEVFSIREESRKLKKLSLDSSQSDGMCEECGEYSELLRVEDRFLCPACRENLY